MLLIIIARNNNSFIQPFGDWQLQYDIAVAGDTESMAARGKNEDNLWLWQFNDNDNSDDEIKHDDCIDEGGLKKNDGGLVGVKALRGLSVKCEVRG